MRHGSLFSGIGGFDLAAEWMNWENVFHCEKNPFGQRVLKHYWPKAESLKDITTTDFSKYHGAIDIISGGFPCQPYSVGGKRKGKDDDRHLWPEMCRAIKEVAPSYVVGENVRGLTNWNDGLVFGEVCADLENLGYQVAPYIIPASAVNAPHERQRLYIIAYSNNKRLQGREVNSDFHQTKGEGEFHRDASRQVSDRWQNFPSQPPICGTNDGLPTKLDGITFSKWRRQSLMAYGNAVVPQLILQIFKTIENHEKENSSRKDG